MAVKYTGGGGGGFWNNLLGIASLLIPGAGPYAAGAGLLGNLLGGKGGAKGAGGAIPAGPVIPDYDTPGDLSPWMKFNEMMPSNSELWRWK